MKKLIIGLSLIACSCVYVFGQEFEGFPQDQGMQPAAQTQPMPQQQPAAPEVKQDVVVDQWEQVSGLDTTIDEGRGDWYNKRKILKKARQLDEAVRQRVQEIERVAEQVKQEHEANVVRLAKAITQLPFTQVHLDRAKAKLEEAIKVRSAETEKKTDADRQLLVDLNDSKKMLDEFIGDVAYLQEIQKGVAQAIELVNSQVGQGKAYEQQSWQLYERIDQALSDRLAEQLFEEMRAIDGNVTAIRQYISQDLPAYLISMNQLFQTQKTKVDQAYTTLVGRKVIEVTAASVVQSTMGGSFMDAMKAKISGFFASFMKILAAIGSFFVDLWAWIKSWFV